jgi:hypothetical protein
MINLITARLVLCLIIMLILLIPAFLAKEPATRELLVALSIVTGAVGAASVELKKN